MKLHAITRRPTIKINVHVCFLFIYSQPNVRPCDLAKTETSRGVILMNHPCGVHKSDLPNVGDSAMTRSELLGQIRGLRRCRDRAPRSVLCHDPQLDGMPLARPNSCVPVRLPEPSGYAVLRPAMNPRRD